MRRQARHRPEGQGIARTCLEFRFSTVKLFYQAARKTWKKKLPVLCPLSLVIRSMPPS